MSLTVNRMTNCAVLIDGFAFIGQAEEVTLPDIVALVSETKGLGMMGKLELPTGGIDKMSAKIKWNSAYPEVLTLSADPFTAHQFQIRANLETWEASSLVGSQDYIVFLTATFKKHPLGAFKPFENAEFETELNVTRVKQVIDGVVINEVSVFGNKWRSDVSDLAATVTDMLGVGIPGLGGGR